MNKKYRFVNYEPSLIRFYNQEHDKLYEDITLLAIGPETDSIMCLGIEVKENRHILERENMVIGSIFKNGVVAEFDLSVKIFKYYFRKKAKVRRFPRPKIAVCTSVEMTQVEERALSDLIHSLGAKDVLIIEEPFEKAKRDIPSTYRTIIEIIPEA